MIQHRPRMRKLQLLRHHLPLQHPSTLLTSPEISYRALTSCSCLCPLDLSVSRSDVSRSNFTRFETRREEEAETEQTTGRIGGACSETEEGRWNRCKCGRKRRKIGSEGFPAGVVKLYISL